MTRTGLTRAAALVAVALVGVLVGRASISVAEPAHQPSATPRAEPTPRSAALAAIEYLDALRWNVVVDDTERRRVIRARATADAADGLDRELAEPAAALRAAVTVRPVVARAAVLGYRVLHADPRRASIRVWGLALFGTGSYEPTTQWSTSDIELVWSAGRWLVDGVESRGGPAPSFSVRALARRIRGLQEIRHVP